MEWTFLAVAIKARGITVKALAEYFSVSTDLVYLWRNGRAAPNAAQFVELAELLGVPLAPLVYSNRKLAKDITERAQARAKVAA